MTDHNCPFLEEIQDCLDTGTPVSKEVQNHIYEGPGCSSCKDLLESVRMLREASLHLSENHKQPDLQIPKEFSKKPATKRLLQLNHPVRSALTAAALLAVLFMGFLQGYNLYTDQKFLRLQTRSFVEELIDEDLLEVPEYQSSLPEGWFD